MTFMHAARVLSRFSRLRLFAAPWTVARQAPPSTEFSRQGYWSGLPFSSPGDIPDPGIEPASPALAGRFFTTAVPGKPKQTDQKHIIRDGVKTRTQMSLAHRPKYLLTIWGLGRGKSQRPARGRGTVIRARKQNGVGWGVDHYGNLN